LTRRLCTAVSADGRRCVHYAGHVEREGNPHRVAAGENEGNKTWLDREEWIEPKDMN